MPVQPGADQRSPDDSGRVLAWPGICWQPFVDWAWPAYKFNKTYWVNGFGWDDCCNTDLPLGRIFSALWLLNYSADDYWNEDWNGNALHWACSYVRV